MESNCKVCLFYDKCRRDIPCENFSPAEDELETEEYFHEIHNEYFHDFQSYLKEFGK